jgi:hypothetical protein
MIKRVKCDLFHPHVVAYRTVPSEIGYRSTYRQKYCIRCKRDIGMSETQRYELNLMLRRIKNFILENLILMVFAIVLIAVGAVVTLTLIAQKETRANTRIACNDYGYALGYSSHIADDGKCYFNINSSWISTNDYESYLQIKNIVEE